MHYKYFKGHFFSDHSTLTNRPDAKMQLSLIFLRISSSCFFGFFAWKLAFESPNLQKRISESCIFMSGLFVRALRSEKKWPLHVYDLTETKLLVSLYLPCGLKSWIVFTSENKTKGIFTRLSWDPFLIFYYMTCFIKRLVHLKGVLTLKLMFQSALTDSILQVKFKLKVHFRS